MALAVCLVAGAVQAQPAAAQCILKPGEQRTVQCRDAAAPEIYISPSGGSSSVSEWTVQATWTDESNTQAPIITLNDTIVSLHFTTTTRNAPVDSIPYGLHGTSEGTFQLKPGSNVLSVKVCDDRNYCATKIATYTFASGGGTPPLQAPVVGSPGRLHTPEEVVRAVFRQVLLREPADFELSWRANQLRERKEGQDVHAMIQAYVSTDEFQDRFVRPFDAKTAATNVYHRLVGREPTAAEGNALIAAATSRGWTTAAWEVLFTPAYLGRYGRHSVPAPGQYVRYFDSGQGSLALDPAPITPIRNACSSAGAAPGTMIQCGDLVLAQGLQPLTVMGHTYSPTFLYNSQHAYPTPSVGAWVTPSPGGGNPTQVSAVLKVQLPGGLVTLAQWDWFGGSADWPAGQPRRIALSFASDLPTGVHDFVIETSLRYSTGQVVNYSIQGSLPVVNRKQSPYGQGWWPAGLDHVTIPDQATALLVTGDGSIQRMYASYKSPNTWVSNGFDRADTLRLDPATGIYTRRLPDGSRVEYQYGLQTGVVDRVGRRTSFVYATVPNFGQVLTHIVLPTGDRYFHFHYNDTGRIFAVSTVAAGNARDAAAFSISGGRLLNHSDPSSGRPNTAFTYDNVGRIASRRDPSGTYTYYEYDAVGKLSKATLDLQSTGVPNPAWTITSQHGIGRQYPTAAEHVYATFDGPRTDVVDQVRLWIDAWGAATRSVDPFNGAVSVERADPRYPALVTRSQGPDNVVTRAWYDQLGRTDSTRVENPLGDGRHAVTRFTYDARWTHFPTRVVGPDGVAHVAGYNAADGSLLWTQVGSDTTRRVKYEYVTTGVAVGQVKKVRTPLPGGRQATTIYGYDVVGNRRFAVDPRGIYSLVDRDVWGRPVDTYTAVDSASGSSEPDLRRRNVRTRIVYSAAGADSMHLTRGPSVTVPWMYGTWSTLSTLPSEGLAVQTVRDELGRVTEVARWNWTTTSFDTQRPDEGTDGLTISEYQYNRAGQVTLVREGANSADQFKYDVAGNMVEETSGNGPPITYTYDAMGRAVKRTTPAVRHARACLPAVTETDGDLRLPGYPSDCGSAPKFPFFPNDVNGAYVIGQDVATFWYDAAGRLYAADNRDARIRRTYLPGGMLHTDSVQIRDVTGNDFSAHTYGITYRYDLAGRLTSLTHPSNLAGPASRDSITYDATTGALARITSRTGVTFDHAYNGAGWLESRTVSNSIGTDVLTYDVVGQLTQRTGPVFTESNRYDIRGKNVWRQDTAGREFYSHFNGLGGLAATEWRRTPKGGLELEEFVTNAVGQTQWRRRASDTDLGYHPVDTLIHDQNSGRVRWISVLAPRDYTTEDSTRWETTRLFYDAMGNTRWSRYLRQTRDPYNRVERAYYHGADNRLAAVQTLNETGLFFTGERRGSFEEHRYDALGRRVLKRTRRGGLCNTSSGSVDCASAVERFVWAGDELLWELRSKDGAPGTVGDEFGAVGYTHGGGTDRPLVMWKGTGASPANVIVPHAAWRGSFGAGTDVVGSASARIHWPAFSSTAWYGQIAPNSPNKLWFGSLVSESREVSGLMYRRARFYDPQAGQFTQSDPIGVGGGLNTYGFGGGDPVSNRDPSGLSPESNGDCGKGMERQPNGTCTLPSLVVVGRPNFRNRATACQRNPSGTLCGPTEPGTYQFGNYFEQALRDLRPRARDLPMGYSYAATGIDPNTDVVPFYHSEADLLTRRKCAGFAVGSSITFGFTVEALFAVGIPATAAEAKALETGIPIAARKAGFDRVMDATPKLAAIGLTSLTGLCNGI
jgi:RHS repeat-associated protein